jgi:tryptophan synthase alpha chain
MNRISNAFKNGRAFIGFLTAGDPSLNLTEEFILELAAGGADLIEIGIPFSDPVADGPTIARANIRALELGVNVSDVFEVVRKVRAKSDVPLVILSYLNPVYFYGYERFFADGKAAGIDGIIIPDLPFEESREVTDVAEKHGVDLITFVTPTSEGRIEMLAKESKGFIYFVSSLGVTGIREEIETNLKPAIDEIRRFTDTPVAVGFGISRPEQAREIAETADGVIIGSAIVEIIEKHGESAGSHLREYARSIKSAIGE